MSMTVRGLQDFIFGSAKCWSLISWHVMGAVLRAAHRGELTGGYGVRCTYTE